MPKGREHCVVNSTMNTGGPSSACFAGNALGRACVQVVQDTVLFAVGRTRRTCEEAHPLV
jgi:hypothetical protein